MRPSRTIIFDLSEVLIAGLIGIERPLATRLGVAQRDILRAVACPEVWRLFRGQMKEDEYLARILAREGWRLPPADFKHTIRRNFRRRVPGMGPLLRRLARQYELVLLSDHAAEWVAYIRRIHPWLRIFRRRFFSFELGQTKLESSTFRKVLAALGRQPDECVLVDDSPRNFPAAAAAGIRTIHFTGADRLTAELDPYWRPFHFRHPGRLVDGDLELVLVARHPADLVKRHVPDYEFEMRRTGTRIRLGLIRLRIGTARRLRYPGHIGYEVDPPHRGHRYAARSCGLVLPLARAHGLKAVWLTVDPANAPSIRTCDLIGARYVETVRIPMNHEMYVRGARYRRRYRLGLR